ncbi:hypothetical protein DPMN_076461, partial [Dreissena polymorpha]
VQPIPKDFGKEKESKEKDKVDKKKEKQKQKDQLPQPPDDEVGVADACGAYLLLRVVVFL